MAASGTRELVLPGELCVELHLSGEDTGGALRMLVDHPPPGWSLPAHRHCNEAETVHVLEGEFSITLDGEERLLGRGETVHVPAGVVHSGANVGQATGRRMLIFSPAGIEGFFIESDIRGGRRQPPVAEQLALARRYGWEFERAR